MTMHTLRYTPPPSYVGVSMTATQAVIATVTPGLARDGGGLLAQALDPAAVIPRSERSRRPHVARALDLGGRIAAALSARPVRPARVLLMDPMEAVARNQATPIQLRGFAGVTGAGVALAAALDAAGIDWDCVDRRTLAGAVHGDPTAGESTLSLHSAAMYGEVAAGGKGRAGQALDLAVLAAYRAGALDEQSWALLSTADWPAFDGVDVEPAPVAEAEPAPAPPVEEGGDSTPAAQTPAAQTTEPEPEPEEPTSDAAASPLRQVAAAIIARDGLSTEQVTEWAGLLGPAPLLAAAEQRGEKAVAASAARALGVEAGNGVLAAVLLAAADAGGEIADRVRDALRPAPAA